MLTAFAAIVALGVSAPASALVISGGSVALTDADVGESFTVTFDGWMDDTFIAGLSAEADFTFSTFDDGEATFDVVLTNTSGGDGVTSSRVSVLGFDTNPDYLDASVSGVFNFVADGQMASLGTMELCVKDVTGDNCSGGGSGGVSLGDSGNFQLVIDFGAGVTDFTLSNFGVRYQDVTLNGVSGLSAVGVGTPGGPPPTDVPEPASLLLLGTGLLGLGVMLRRKASEA